jgi:hypothetical protein
MTLTEDEMYEIAKIPICNAVLEAGAALVEAGVDAHDEEQARHGQRAILAVLLNCATGQGLQLGFGQEEFVSAAAHTFRDITEKFESLRQGLNIAAAKEDGKQRH